LAGSHSVSTKYQHHQAGLEMEPTGETEEREPKEQLATVIGGGDGNSWRDGHNIEWNGETSLRAYAPQRGERV